MEEMKQCYEINVLVTCKNTIQIIKWKCIKFIMKIILLLWLSIAVYIYE